MKKIIYWLKKLGILRSGSYTAKGDAKKINEMKIAADLYQSDKEIEISSNKKSKGTQKKVATKKNKSLIGKITFVVFVFISIVFLFAFWGSGWTFWTVLGILLWGFFLKWFWTHISSGQLALGKILVFGFLAIVVSFAVVPSEDGGADIKLTTEKTISGSSSTKKNTPVLLGKDVKQDAVTDVLLDIKKSTGFDFSVINNDNIVWTAQRVSLQLEKAKSFSVEGLSPKDFDKLQAYFIDKKATTGGIGFTFAPPAGTLSSGFALKHDPYFGMMCVMKGVENNGVVVGCGWGPTDNPLSK